MPSFFTSSYHPLVSTSACVGCSPSIQIGSAAAGRAARKMNSVNKPAISQKPAGNFMNVTFAIGGRPERCPGTCVVDITREILWIPRGSAIQYRALPGIPAAMKFNRFAPLLFLCVIGCASVARAAVDASIAKFFDDHCVKCHGPDKQKGDVRLDTLSDNFADPELRETWTKIAQMIDHGDMPPKKEARPDAAAIDTVVCWIGKTMWKTASEHPLAVRRMNRLEYENTVHDLLGIDTPLAALLPEDSSVQGFDNVSDGLSISSVLLERYMEAADAAFDGVIRRIEPEPVATRRSITIEEKENKKSIEEKRAGVMEVDGSFVKFRPGWPPIRIDDAHPHETGVYHCRIAIWPYQSPDHTPVLAVFVGPLFGPGENRFVGMFDVTGTSQEPRIIEFTTRMKEGDSMHLVPWIYPEVPGWSKDPKPGIAVKWVETEGPLDQDFPSKAQKALFGDLPMIETDHLWMRYRKNVRRHEVNSEHPKEDAQRILSAFIPKAFRRPVDAAGIEPYVALVDNLLDNGRTFEQAMRAGITAVLCSPQFLLINSDTRVDDYTLASRLSYFLWSSMPDDELMQLAATGKLRDPAVRDQQVERMLKDPRSQQFVTHFTDQWLDLAQIKFTTPDAKLYPEFDDLLETSMLGETRGFFRHILENDLSVTNFIDSDFAVLNERMAGHYKIDGVKGNEKFQIVKLPADSARGGVMAQASVLKVTANGTNTSPVLRGVWILDRMLGQPPPPPPAGVPAIEPDIRGATTIREQLDKHRANPSCARCHARIDPPGFALEHFDPIGLERDSYRSLGEGKNVGKSYKIGKPVQTDAEMSDGRSFTTFQEFRTCMMDDKMQVARSLAQKLLVYGTGRPVGVLDRPAIDGVVEYAGKNNLGLRSMIHGVVHSDLFTRP
ncbi:MAG: DUF1592 domain-containing protein [Planctomycetes bacterium]|nr:DUF1592 domain-containing protein [Planctomycetota bacterium]